MSEQVSVETETERYDPELKTASKDCLQHVEHAAVAESVLSPEEERRLVRKLDLHIIPMLISLYVMGFLDRVNIGQNTNFSRRHEMKCEADSSA